MTALFRSRQRAEEFSARVDGSAIGHLRSPDPETERLLGVVRTLRAQPHTDAAAPRDAFVVDLRERLMAEAATVLSPASTESPESTENAETADLRQTRAPRRRERRLVAVATAAVVLGGTAGVATAARSALPGEALYPVKRVIEQVDVRLSTSPQARGHDLLKQAAGRLDEVQGLIAEDSATSAAEVPGTLDAFTKQSREGAGLLLVSYRDTRRAESVAEVRRFAADGLGTLAELADAAPAGARPDVRDAALVLRAIDQQARALCASCTDLPALALPPTFRVSAEAARALADVNAAKLDNTHPVVVGPSGGNRRAVGPTGALADAARASRAQSGGVAEQVAPLAPAAAPDPERAAPAPAARAPAARATGPRVPAAPAPAAPAARAPAIPTPAVPAPAVPAPAIPEPAVPAPAIRVPAAPAPVAPAARASLTPAPPPLPSAVVPSIQRNPLPAIRKPSGKPPVKVDVNRQDPVDGVKKHLGRPAGKLLPKADPPSQRLP